MVRLVEEKPNTEFEVIAAAMREAFAPRTAGARAEAAPAERIQSLINAFPGYELVRELHRGGQGVVYQALQKSTRRQVALKVMRDGPFADSHDRARFEREVQILAQLDHPNVVAIHDSGVAHDRFFYVMDYVPGRPLDEYVADEDPSIEELLRLFQLIADAVNAAHLRGVTHRDLKPSNVLVVVGDDEGTKGPIAVGEGTQGPRDPGTKGKSNGSHLHSSVPAPKVLDFGLAKLTTPELASAGGETTMTLAAMTISGQFVGSLPWASPEQAEGSPGKIDLRTDVYSLGVMMYQMLTGHFPYPVAGRMRDVADNIINATPTRPHALRREINDEVETIVLKCLSKERERRYQTAGELARDIGRYLAGEPIEAKRDSGWYVLRKALRRYRVPVFVAGAFVVMLAAATVTLSVMHGRAVVGEQRARAAERRAVQANKVAMQILADDFLKRLVRGEATANTVLDDVARQSESEFDDPLLAAVIHNAVGRAYFAIGGYPEAEKHLRAEVELRRRLPLEQAEDFEALAASLNSLGECLRERGEQSKEGASDFQAALELHRESSELARVHLGEGHVETARSLHDLASAHWWLNEFETARPLFEQALEIRRRIGEQSEDTAESLSYLAACLDRQGEHATAEAHYRQSLAIREHLPSTVPFDLAAVRNNLATSLLDQKRYAEAEVLFRGALETMVREAGEQHPWVERVRHNLGRCLAGQGQWEQADEVLSETLARKRAQLGPRAISTAKTLCELAKVRHARGMLEQAEGLCREALDIQGDHADSVETRRVLAEVLAEAD